MLSAERIIKAGINSTENKKVKDRLEDLLENGLYYNGYSEPGYSDPENGVALSNWNDIDGEDTMGRVCKLLERNNIGIEWEDEWTSCGECGKLVRTVDNSYSWQRSYVIIDECELVCLNCIDPKEHLESLEGKSNLCNTILRIDPLEYGYKKVNGDFENGLHIGQNDDPKAIGLSMHVRGISRYIFNLESTDQFGIIFALYVHESEYTENLKDCLKVA